MAKKPPPDTTDMKVRVPTIIKKSLEDLGRKEGNSAPSLIRRFIADGLDAAKDKNKK
jgi:hypothetical protein